MDQLVEAYLSTRPPADLYEFLSLRFRALHERHGGVVGMQVRDPQAAPCEQCAVGMSRRAN